MHIRKAENHIKKWKKKLEPFAHTWYDCVFTKLCLIRNLQGESVWCVNLPDEGETPTRLPLILVGNSVYNDNTTPQNKYWK